MDVIDIKAKLYIPILFPLLILFCLISDLRSLSWLSSFANIIMLVVFISIYQYLFSHAQQLSELENFAGWNALPLFFGASTYAFEAVALVSGMRKHIKIIFIFTSLT